MAATSVVLLLLGSRGSFLLMNVCSVVAVERIQSSVVARSAGLRAMTQCDTCYDTMHAAASESISIQFTRITRLTAALIPYANHIKWPSLHPTPQAHWLPMTSGTRYHMPTSGFHLTPVKIQTWPTTCTSFDNNYFASTNLRQGKSQH